MKKSLLIFTVLLFFSCAEKTTEAEDIAAITAIIKEQEKAWSNHDLEGFMQGYWKSEKLTYYSRTKISQGWQTTLDKYKKGYPTPKETGTLSFQLDNITKISDDAYWVMGQYFLIREVGDVTGTFMIVFKKINGEWKIIGDSSC
jgi:ketosteroid isomerase-like protein